MTVLLILFQFVFLLFLFLLWLLWLKLPKLCWIIVVRVDNLVLFLTLEKWFHFFTTENNIDCGFVIYRSLLCWGRFPLCSLSGEFFIINVCWIVSKAFSAPIEMIIWFLFFNLLIWCITLIDLHILKNPCIPEINPTWSWCMILLPCCWILFASILLRIFAYIFSSDIGL